MRNKFGLMWQSVNSFWKAAKKKKVFVIHHLRFFWSFYQYFSQEELTKCGFSVQYKLQFWNYGLSEMTPEGPYLVGKNSIPAYHSFKQIVIFLDCYLKISWKFKMTGYCFCPWKVWCRNSNFFNLSVLSKAVENENFN